MTGPASLRSSTKSPSSRSSSHHTPTSFSHHLSLSLSLSLSHFYFSLSLLSSPPSVLHLCFMMSIPFTASLLVVVYVCTLSKLFFRSEVHVKKIFRVAGVKTHFTYTVYTCIIPEFFLALSGQILKLPVTILCTYVCTA